MSRPELVTLRTFLSVYRTGGVAKAAASLGLSQPAVSQHLRAIEESMGRPLFARAGRGIAPTEVGHALAAQVAEHLDALEGAVGGMRSDADRDTGPVFLGAPADLLAGYALPLLAPLLARGLVVHCRTGLSPDLTEALLRDELDAALVTKIEGAPTRQLFLRHSHDEEFVLVGAVDQAAYDPYHGASGRGFVGYSEEMPMARRYFRLCWGMPPPAPVLTVADMRGVVAVVAAGAGLGVVPRYLARDALDAGRLRVLHTPREPVTNAIYLATRRGRERSPSLRALFERLTGDG
ncbi:LysR family transcriptional regulator [Streptomyces sp. LX-29]|uniref:LysR family transcriptional regulator n=1 Tax=Streptomyces sp. LX-29 TaxID=2900152 RepID=UPI00240E80C2|nr:LysR family transcriptional regulator [Streptomyces sp. LX-29]WFB10891.1 LysR family transcriptional regulator [Streptomyces sp. LX-29]